MATEIERKFLVSNDFWKHHIIHSQKIIQAYISHRPEGIVRLRICNEKAYLTLKGKNNGLIRHEWEYEIPVKNAYEMLESKIYEGDYLEKTRYKVLYDNLTWEIDEFHGRYKGLVLAEIELADADEQISLPPFVGKEVSHDPRYFNSNLNQNSLIH